MEFTAMRPASQCTAFAASPFRSAAASPCGAPRQAARQAPRHRPSLALRGGRRRWRDLHSCKSLPQRPGAGPCAATNVSARNMREDRKMPRISFSREKPPALPGRAFKNCFSNNFGSTTLMQDNWSGRWSRGSSQFNRMPGSSAVPQRTFPLNSFVDIFDFLMNPV